MDELTVFIEKKIREFVVNGVGVIFSPPSDPGEGEHKIMNFIRARSSPEIDPVFGKLSHCIYSPDGDLIMLCMTTYLNEIYLLRPGQETGVFELLNMSFVAKNLLESVYSPNVISRNMYDTVNDFVLAGFFVGNDFLPKIQMFYTLEEGLQSMLNVCKYLSQNNKFITTGGGSGGGKISHSGFSNFVSLIANDEKAHLLKQAQTFYPPNSEREKFNDDLLRKHLSTEGADVTTKNTLDKFDYFSYSKEYYEVRFPGVDSSDVCEEYLKSLLWVFVYYTQKIPSWRYHYKYHYAPLMKEFSVFMKTQRARDILKSPIESVFDIGEPCAAPVQLACVLPTPSKYLIPEKFRSLKIDDPEELNFKIDYTGKVKEYMGVALISPADIDTIEREYKAIMNGEEDIFRNPTFYFYDPKSKKVNTMNIEN